MAEIKKKTWPDLFEEVLAGRKVHEFRLADFDLKVGDTLVLEEWDPETGEYTGRQLRKRVGYVSHLDLSNTFWSKEDIEKHGLYVASLKDE